MKNAFRYVKLSDHVLFKLYSENWAIIQEASG